MGRIKEVKISENTKSGSDVLVVLYPFLLLDNLSTEYGVNDRGVGHHGVSPL